MEEINIEGMAEESQTAVDEAASKKFSEDSPDNAIAHIAASQGLHIGMEEKFLHAYVWTENRSGDDIRVGDYLRIPVGDEQIFAIVKALNYETESISVQDLDDFALEGDGEINKDRYPMIAVLEPITTLYENENSNIERRAVDTLPRPLEFVQKVTDRDYIYKGLNLPKEGIPTGHISVGGQEVTDASGDKIVYNLLNPQPGSSKEPSIFRHMLVAGATGKGKTQLSKNILRQFSGGPEGPKYDIEDQNGNSKKVSPSTIIIDPENEYSELAKDPQLDDHGEELLKRYEEQGFRTGGAEDVVSFIPDIKSSDDIKTEADSYRDFSIPFKVVKGRPRLLMPFDAKAPTISSIKNVMNDYFRKENNKPTYSGFIQYAKTNRDRYINGDGNIHESSWKAMMNRIDQDYFRRVFDQGSTSLYELEKEIFTPGRISVIPTDHIRGKEEKLVVMSILSHIVENKLKTGNVSKDVNNTPIIVCVDEAHNYLSSRENIQEEYIIKRFIEAAKQGRKEKLGLYMVTQNPADIDEEIRHQTNTKTYMGLEKSTIDKINIPSGFEDRIPIFERGQAVIKAPDVRGVEIKGLEIPLTLHKS